MAIEAPPQERAQRSHLQHHPQQHGRHRLACGGCIFYAPRTDAEGYCTQPEVQLDVAASWWCKYHEKDGSSTKFAGHPLHPALIPFPLAFTFAALAFDILAEATGRAGWRREAKHMLVAGTASGIMAAPSGLSDWLALPVDRPAKGYGLVHGLGNLLLLALNGLNIALRNGSAQPTAGRRTAQIGLSVSSGLLGIATGWIGGQLAYRFGVGVEAPTNSYRIFEFRPVVRIAERAQWQDGQLKIPADSVWNGPEIPSKPMSPS